MFPTTIEPGDNDDMIATIDCNLSDLGDPLCDYRSRRQIHSEGRSFPQPAFDDDGKLYVAYSKVGVDGPGIHQYEGNFRSLKIDPTPGLAVGALAGTSVPAVFMAWVTDTGMQNFAIEIAAANSSDLTKWTVNELVMRIDDTSNPHQWAPSLVLDPERNTLDLVHFWVEDDPTEQSMFQPALTRYRAHDLTLLAQQLVPTDPNIQTPLLGALPSRNAEIADVNKVFVGEYLGLDVRDGVAYIGWPMGVRGRDDASDLATSRLGLLCGEDLP